MALRKSQGSARAQGPTDNIKGKVPFNYGRGRNIMQGDNNRLSRESLVQCWRIAA